MTKQERIDLERAAEREERAIAATNRLAAATERVADAQETVVHLQPGGTEALAFVKDAAAKGEAVL